MYKNTFCMFYMFIQILSINELYNFLPTFLLFSVNTLILQQTGETAVTFIYLPPPPNDESHAVPFYNHLETLSKNLPPTIFVHGVNTVTSTTL